VTPMAWLTYLALQTQNKDVYKHRSHLHTSVVTQGGSSLHVAPRVHCLGQPLLAVTCIVLQDSHQVGHTHGRHDLEQRHLGGGGGGGGRDTRREKHSSSGGSRRTRMSRSEWSAAAPTSAQVPRHTTAGNGEVRRAAAPQHCTREEVLKQDSLGQHLAP
jgi:hypothetical protein